MSVRRAPSLSVMMPAYNAERFIEEAVRGVLAQTFTDFELLVVDDGSTDRTLAIVQAIDDPRIVVVSQPNQGAGAARRKAVTMATAPIITCADADDVSRPNRFAAQMAFLAAHPDHVLVASQMSLLREGRLVGQTAYRNTDEEIKKQLLRFNPIPQPSVMFRKAAYVGAGGYRDDYRTAEDYDLWLRMHRFGRFHVLEEPLVDYRLHGGQSKTSHTKRQLRETIAVKRKAVKEHGYTWSAPSLAIVMLEWGLQIVPSSWIVYAHRKLFYRRQS